jgi:DNA-binding MarR family transcriptional regulator
MVSKQAFDIANYVDRISNLFNRVMLNPLQFRVPEDLSELELTVPQFQGLLYVLQHQGCSVGDMAEGLSISHPAAVKMVERLHKKGLVEKSECEHDHRVSNLGLTEYGAEVARKVQSERSEVMWRALGRMKQEEIESLVKGLEALLESALDNEDMLKAACLRCGSSHIGCCVVNRTSVAMTGNGIEKP